MSKPIHSPCATSVHTGRRNFLRHVPEYAAAAGGLLLSGCGTGAVQSLSGKGYLVDTSISSPNQASRVHTLVMHYTVAALAESIEILTDPNRTPRVSAHYLVPDTADDAQPFRVYELVPEGCEARHAGASYWQGVRTLNASAIGIEIVNSGFPAEDADLPLMLRRWYPYSQKQIAVVAALSATIIERHKITPDRVVGHSDIAPGRKEDPGPMFPWQHLYAQYQIGAWPDADVVAYYQQASPFRADFLTLQKKLLAYGYEAPQTGVLDAQTVNVVAAFQMHFRAARYDGQPDIETVAILDALLKKYAVNS